MVHLYVGEGKGKTTAAVGLALRALGAGWRVAVVQFLKSAPSGEMDMLKTLGVRVLRSEYPIKFIWDMNEDERRLVRESHDTLLRTAFCQEVDLLVLDEACGAVETGLVDEELLRKSVENRSSSAEIVLTGRHPAPWMEAFADYETEMRCLKHPYERGVTARKGVEF